MSLWLVIVAVVVAGFAVLSLGSTHATYNDLKSGTPGFVSLVDYTGICEKDRIIKLFGPPDSKGRFHISAQQLLEAGRHPLTWFFDHPAADSFCAIAPVFCIFSYEKNPPLAICLVVLCGLFQLVGWGLAIYRVARYIDVENDQLF